MERTLIKDLGGKIGQQATISGWVDVRRDHGKLIFFDLRDRSGKIQAVVLPARVEARPQAEKLRSEWVVRVLGNVNKRPEKMVKDGVLNGDIELEILEIEILSEAAEMPFERDSALNLDTYLDNLPLTLRTERSKAIFKVQALIATGFRDYLNQHGFTEFQAPKLIGEDAEGGANSFSLEYFGHTAHLAQSPQLYKQIMVGVFERVFAVGNVYRAEKHATSRHLNEYTSLDIEMGFIQDHEDIMNLETDLLRYITLLLKEQCAAEFLLLDAEIPEVPEKIPRLKLREAQKIITAETRVDCTAEPDLEPQHERFLCEYSKQKWNSDFLFVTHFPISKRPFYTYEDEADKGYAKGFDLLFRGIEITTGAQRIHRYDDLVASLKRKKLDPEKFAYYLQAFTYGLPPHGGFGMGLERLTAKFLNLDNVKEATLFPRDINRIDALLSTDRPE